MNSMSSTGSSFNNSPLSPLISILIVVFWVKTSIKRYSSLRSIKSSSNKVQAEYTILALYLKLAEYSL